MPARLFSAHISRKNVHALQYEHERNEQPVERALSMVADVRASRSYDTTTLPVALREVRSLIRGGSLDGTSRTVR